MSIFLKLLGLDWGKLLSRTVIVTAFIMGLLAGAGIDWHWAYVSGGKAEHERTMETTAQLNDQWMDFVLTIKSVDIMPAYDTTGE
jgi:hypothetical protein